MPRNDDKLEGGPITDMTLQVGLETTDAFLRWYRNWLKENSPLSTSEIRAANYIIDSLPEDIEELEQDADLEEEEDEEDGG